jgi:ribosome biogenesis GTPase
MPFTSLGGVSALGWNEQLARLSTPYLTSDLCLGRVIRAERERYWLSNGEHEWAAEVSGHFRHDSLSPAELPAVGDWVGFRPPPGSGPALIDVVLPRQTRFLRQAAGGRTGAQILAANVDWLWVVMGLDRDYNLRRIERFLTAAEDSGARVAIVLNKADCRDEPACAKEEVQGLRADLPVLVVSAKTGQGLAELEASLMPGLTYALVGSSGVGKSSLINRLLGSDLLATAPVRAGDDRGCHTTTRRELLLLPQGSILMDTPGLRELALWAGSEAPWEATFAEIAELALGCRYRDCRHQSEPGCAVRAALERGELEPGRYRSYEKQIRELDYQRARQDQGAAQLRIRHSRSIARFSRALAKLKRKGL